MYPQTDKSWRDYRTLNQNWSYQPTLAGRAIDGFISAGNPHFPKNKV